MSKRKSIGEVPVKLAKSLTKTKPPSKKAKESNSELSTSSKPEGDVKRDKDGKLMFADWPTFKPNLTPKEMMQLGSFGGTYFRPIYSSVTSKNYSSEEWKEFPSEWFENMKITMQVTSLAYRNEINKYGVKCGGDLNMWESSGWIKAQDPYGWFQWYCRFYLGRRTEDDERQVKRWLNCTGPKGRWKNNLIGKCVRGQHEFDDKKVSPVVRQTLQHWAYVLTKKDFDAHVKNVKL